MENAQQLADRFREVFLNGKWIANTNFKDQLDNLNWQQATQQFGTLNTLAALTFHVDYYIGGIINVFQGGGLDIRDKFSFDMPPITSAADWDKLRRQLWADAETFAGYVEQLSADQLDAPFVDEKYGSYRRNIEAMIEHGYYHLGQVSLIRKLLATD